jgi:hypothetical protein
MLPLSVSVSWTSLALCRSADDDAVSASLSSSFFFVFVEASSPPFFFSPDWPLTPFSGVDGLSSSDFAAVSLSAACGPSSPV